MRGCVLSVFLLVLCMAVASEAIGCDDPRPLKDTWVTSSFDGKECVVLVKKKCPGMSKYSTSEWRRGKRVKDNCSIIPQWTAIATFLDGAKYRGHAAIFESCAPNGIWVYDQWNTAPVDRRLIKYGSTESNYDGNNFYVIEL